MTFEKSGFLRHELAEELPQKQNPKNNLENSLAVLARKVRARKKFLDSVVGPVVTLVRKYGKLISRDQGSGHTNIVGGLCNFDSFTFSTDLYQTQFGGNSIKIWYHPGRVFREGGLDSAYDPDWTPVLHVYFQTDFRVTCFKEDAKWQRALKHVLRNQVKIAARIVKRRTMAIAMPEKARRNFDEGNNPIITEAKNLGLLPP